MSLIRLLAATSLITLNLSGALAINVQAEEADVIGLNELIDQTLQMDPLLNALRWDVQIAEAERHRAAPLNNPHVRLGYSDRSDTTDLETLLDPTATPDSGLSDRSEQYTAQLRLYPRNPFIAGAQKERANLEKSLAERKLAAAIHAKRMDICETYFDMIHAQREHALWLRKYELQQTIDHQQRALFEAGQLDPETYNENRLRGLDLLIELGRAELAFTRVRDKLRADAGLRDHRKITAEYPAYMNSGLVARLNLDVLMETALENNDLLASINLECDITQADLSATRGEGIPWVNLISATYQREERYATKYRDEFSVVAGIELPIFDWLSNRKIAPDEARLQGLERQGQDAESALRTSLHQSLTVLKHSEERLNEFHNIEEDVGQAIRQRLSEIEDATDLLQMQKAFRYKRMLMDLEEKSIRINQNHVQHVIEFERLVGVRLVDLFEQP